MSGNSLETRSSHPSLSQVEALVSYLETRPDLARGFKKTQGQRERAQKDWLRISQKLNNMPEGTVKTVKRWMKYWSDKKNAVKRKQVNIEKCRQSGEQEILELSEIEERILTLIKTPTPRGHKGFKTEPDEQVEVESSENVIVSSILLDEEMGDETHTEETNEDEDTFLTNFVDTNRIPHSNGESESTPKVSSSKWSRFKVPQKKQESGQWFFLVADKLCRIEQQRLELDRRIVNVMERNSERDHMIAEAVKAMGEGLKALAEAISRN
ncbi:uncharacterized protein LOC106133701 isoform X2 [Amyelois transitella]|uniref:uncharacterized protein LOC106133701 isoform X2 n=1 Tax=Amyelois transitella TaxID=680683 RepID=UPI00298FD19F|nr:uncharacterized protein LOC106133701 isoform X2 [Amyelois transitella]